MFVSTRIIISAVTARIITSAVTARIITSAVTVRIFTSAVTTRIIRGRHADYPWRACGLSAAAARTILIDPHGSPRLSARNSHGILRKKLSFPCHVPYLSKLAKCLLALPHSSADSESIVRKIVTDFHTEMDKSTVRAVLSYT